MARTRVSDMSRIRRETGFAERGKHPSIQRCPIYVPPRGVYKDEVNQRYHSPQRVFPVILIPCLVEVITRGELGI